MFIYRKFELKGAFNVGHRGILDSVTIHLLYCWATLYLLTLTLSSFFGIFRILYSLKANEIKKVLEAMIEYQCNMQNSFSKEIITFKTQGKGKRVW